jgi:hypothetical protein
MSHSDYMAVLWYQLHTHNGLLVLRSGALR